MHPFNFAVSDYNRDGVGTFNYVHEFRDPLKQYVCALKHSEALLGVAALIAKLQDKKVSKEKKKECTDMLRSEKARLKLAKEELAS
jgi:hypothetical protein